MFLYGLPQDAVHSTKVCDDFGFEHRWGVYRTEFNMMMNERSFYLLESLVGKNVCDKAIYPNSSVGRSFFELGFDSGSWHRAFAYCAVNRFRLENGMVSNKLEYLFNKNIIIIIYNIL